MPLLPEPPVNESSDLLDPQSTSRMEPIFAHPEQFRPNSFFIGREEELKNLHRMLMDRERRSEEVPPQFSYNACCGRWEDTPGSTVCLPAQGGLPRRRVVG